MDDSPLLIPENKKFVQEVTGTFLYYARVVNAKMLTSLGSITTQQASPTKNKMTNITQFLDYAASHPDVIIIYNTIKIFLAGHCDASYILGKKL